MSGTSKGHQILAALRGLKRARTNSRGNTLRESFMPSERYVIDFSGLLQEGWRQYDTEQDAHYFGVWVNTTTLEVLTYAEGDWSLLQAKDREAFRAEIKSMADFYGDPPPAFVVIDGETGDTTYVYDKRPTGEEEVQQ